MPIATLLRNTIQQLQSPAALTWGRYLGIASVSLLGVLVLFFILNSSVEADLYINNSHHVLPVAVMFIPAPIAFLFWLRLIEHQGGRLAMRTSPLWLGISIGMFLSVLTVTMPQLRIACFAAGVICGFLVHVPPREYWRCIRRNPLAVVVLLIAATASINYYWLMKAIWVEMRGLTTYTVFHTLQFFNFDAYAKAHPRVNTTIFIYSPHFMIWVNNACNGLEGIFLFNFLLSIMFLLDWHIFGRWKLFLVYALGIAYMFIVNALRITLFFTVGYWAYRPDVPAWVQSMRGWPVMMFHSYIGWVLYLLAFGLFALVLYRVVGRKKRLQSLSGSASG